MLQTTHLSRACLIRTSHQLIMSDKKVKTIKFAKWDKKNIVFEKPKPGGFGEGSDRVNFIRVPFSYRNEDGTTGPLLLSGGKLMCFGTSEQISKETKKVTGYSLVLYLPKGDKNVKEADSAGAATATKKSTTKAEKKEEEGDSPSEKKKEGGSDAKTEKKEGKKKGTKKKVVATPPASDIERIIIEIHEVVTEHMIEHAEEYGKEDFDEHTAKALLKCPINIISKWKESI